MIIVEVTAENVGKVLLKTKIGGTRILATLFLTWVLDTSFQDAITLISIKGNFLRINYHSPIVILSGLLPRKK